jgi:hypothetical protein
MTREDILNMVPKQALVLRQQNQLHKLASARTGYSDFGLDSAVASIAKKAYFQRHVNKAIASGINSLEELV